ncbi:MAG: Ankyrin [Actinomycetia bacterium]|nr:Ankyrin [Actinomycetes bacterium]
MASRPLPHRPNLEHLRNEARDLQRQQGGKLTAAQLEVARSYGFASWPKLKAHVEIVYEHLWAPEDVREPGDDPVERFLVLACLSYDDDRRARTDEAAAILAERPEVGRANPWAMAAANEADALRAVIAADPEVVHRRGGPARWEPLLYACYARIPGRSTLDAIRALLDAGADPDAGSLWDGFYPFTALTGVFGGGEGNQLEHPDDLAAARLLLEAGANPNDTQTIYNRMFAPSNDHLELLYEFGLGTGDESPWTRRMGPRAWSSTENALRLSLHWAAEHGYTDRVRLLLDHGVEPQGPPPHFNVHRSSYEAAVLAGHTEIAELLEPTPLDEVARFVGACMRGDRAEVEALRTDDLVRRADAEHAPVASAIQLGRSDVVPFLLDVGFAIGLGLHWAAWEDDRELVDLLLARGADLTLVDPEFDGTPDEWAAYAGHPELAAYLEGRKTE